MRMSLFHFWQNLCFFYLYMLICFFNPVGLPTLSVAETANPHCSAHHGRRSASAHAPKKAEETRCLEPSDAPPHRVEVGVRTALGVAELGMASIAIHLLAEPGAGRSPPCPILSHQGGLRLVLLLVFLPTPPRSPFLPRGPQSLALLPLSSAAARRLSAPAAPRDAGRPPALPVGQGVVSSRPACPSDGSQSPSSLASPALHLTCCLFRVPQDLVVAGGPCTLYKWVRGTLRPLIASLLLLLLSKRSFLFCDCTVMTSSCSALRIALPGASSPVIHPYPCELPIP